MLGLQRFDVVHSAHRYPPPSCLRTDQTLTLQSRRVTPNRAPRPPVHKSARMVRMVDPSRPQNPLPERLVVGISGASGVIYGVRLLQAVKALPVEAHLVMTATAEVM